MMLAGASSGGWSQLIVAHVWPSDMTIAGLNSWIENRVRIADSHDTIADLLNTAQTGPLASQKGKTADALIQAFQEGEKLARDVATKNGVKKDSYAAALSSVHNLRDKLSEIADRYNKEINQIIQSSEPAVLKGPQILAAIGRGQQEANVAAANCGSDIGDAGQRILDQEVTGPSFRQFAKANGIDMDQLFRARDTKDLEPIVQGMLTSDGTSGGVGVPGVNPAVSGLSGAATGGFSGGAAGGALGVNPAVSGLSGAATGGFSGGVAGGAPGVNPSVSGLPVGGSAGGGAAGVSPAVSGLPGGGAAGSGGLGSASPATSTAVARSAGFLTTTPGLSPPGAPPTAPPAAPPGPSLATPAGFAGGSAPGTPPSSSNLTAPADFAGGSAPATPPHSSNLTAATNFANGTAPASTMPAGTPPAAPQVPPGATFGPAYSSFGTGAPSGSPGLPFNSAAFQGSPTPSFSPGEWGHHAEMGLGPGANAVPPPVAPPPQVASTPVSPATTPTAGAGDWHSPIPSEQPSAPQASSSSYGSQSASPMMNSASTTSTGYAPSPAAPSTPYSGGALPSYGSDLRPPAASAPAGSPSPPPALNPTPPPASPATSPAAGSGTVSQAASAARPVPSQLTQPPAPIGFAGKAVMAGAGGAVAGAVSADATARIRLQRIVDAVARQEPRLAWAAGDRPDDATVLLTDLAGGWIPPGIEIPSATTLLEPGRRRGDLESLLGEVKLAVNHTPDRYVPEADEPVPTSPRPRRAPEIEELGWELGTATLYRDGLPRMAHTLAKAASSGTGVDGPEAEELGAYLDTIGERVLNAYPDDVDPKDIGNWQLLAAIEALVRGDRISANYHLAWFQARMTTATEHR